MNICRSHERRDFRHPHVYQGEDGELYVHYHDGQLYRDVDPQDLSDHLDHSTYIQAMRTLGEEPIIDIGLPE